MAARLSLTGSFKNQSQVFNQNYRAKAKILSKLLFNFPLNPHQL
jgi:hypothetical protein